MGRKTKTIALKALNLCLVMLLVMSYSYMTFIPAMTQAAPAYSCSIDTFTGEGIVTGSNDGGVDEDGVTVHLDSDDVEISYDSTAFSDGATTFTFEFTSSDVEGQDGANYYAEIRPGVGLGGIQVGCVDDSSEPEPENPLLTVDVSITNDDLGEADESDVTLTVSGDTDTGVDDEVENEFTAGDYTVIWHVDGDYTATFGGDCDADGNITLEANNTYNCTILLDDNEGDDEDGPVDPTGVITFPVADYDEVNRGLVEITAEYDDGDDLNDDAVNWAVRIGTCASGGAANVYGNVNGMDDDYTWNGADFSATIDTSGFDSEQEYCFVFNPTDDGAVDVRESRWFVVEEEADEPENPLLTVDVSITNDDLGEADESDVTLTVSGDTDTGVDDEVENEFTAGDYTVIWDVDGDYTATFGGDCDADGNITMVDDGTYACNVVLNDADAADPTIKVTITSVINNSGGSNDTEDFEILVGNGISTTTISNDTAAEFTPDDYSVEFLYDGEYLYDPSFSGHCDLVGSLNAELEGVYECEVTLDDYTESGSNGGSGGGGVILPPSGNGGGSGNGDGLVLGVSTTTLPTIQQTILPEPLILGETCEEYIFGVYLHIDRENNTEDVRKLQAFLNEEMNAGLPVTGFFGPLTLQAVKDFQVKYADFILAPWGITEPTGYVYKTTRFMINTIKCPDLPKMQTTDLIPDTNIHDNI